MDGSEPKNGLLRAARFAIAGLNQLLWPAVCLNCGDSVGDGVLCKRCWSEVLRCAGGEYCRRCGKDASGFAIVDGACPDCRDKEFNFDGIARAGVYDGSLQQMILSFKKGKTEIDELLGRLAESALQGSDFYKEIELLVPVPLHWLRRLGRGYNQSLILAKQLRHPGAKISGDLVRIRRTKPQTAFDDPKTLFRKRIDNVAGAFAVRRGHNFGGKVVCLVDDVKTSDATLNECAKVLKEAGAAKVYAVVLAVAGQNVG